MARHRTPPWKELTGALAALVYALVIGVVAATIVVAARRHWPEEWSSLPNIVVIVIVLMFGAYAAVPLAMFVVGMFRWRRARRWDQMLDDPDVAHLVPPLEEHSTSVRGRLHWIPFAVASLIALVVGLTLLGSVALSVTPVAPAHMSDRVGPLIIGFVALVAGLVGVRDIRERRRAAQVERWSSEPLSETRDAIADEVSDLTGGPGAAGHVAAAIPRLDVVVDKGADPGRRLPPSAREGDPLPSVLFLRVFDNIEGTQRFLDGAWTRSARVYALRSADQVGATEIENMLTSGDVSTLFIEDRRELDDALETYDARARSSRRQRPDVCALLCHGTFWRTAIDVLLTRVDAVVLDLTGYVPAHAGTRFEIQRVVDRFPVEWVTVLAGARADHRYLAAQLGAAWRNMSAGSPNEGHGRRTLVVWA